MVRHLSLPRGFAIFVGGALLGTALILALVLGGHVRLGIGGAPVVRIEAPPKL